MFRLMSILLTILVFFGMSILMITGAGIVGGLTRDHVVKPFVQRYLTPPLYVDDPRCCR